MREAFGWVLPVLVSLFFIQVASEALYLRAIGNYWSEPNAARSLPARGPTLPVHELEREASAGAMFT